MKIAITGSTNGLGGAFSSLMEQHGHEIIGFNRSNGYDIIDAREQIVQQASDCDIFVNNAWSDIDIMAQTNLFLKMYDQWKFTDKTIVNINSKTHYGNTARPYSRGKKMLHREAFLAMNHPDRECRLINITPGYVDTDRVKSVEDRIKLSREEVAGYIKWALEQPVEIGELSFWRD